MNELRLLLVDDSSLVRRMLIAALKKHPEIEVVAAAPTGAVALARLGEVAVDAVVLDVEMPGMDGVETLVRIRRRFPRLPVVMFSALTERGAEVTVRALAAGASDYVCKPSAVDGMGSEQVVSQQLVPKLLALCGRRALRTEATASLPVETTSWPARPQPISSFAVRAGPLGRQVELVVVASSTGGPNALAELLPKLPADLGVPVLLVQHMPPVFTRYLAERIHSGGPLPAREATDGAPLAPGVILVAPGDYHLEVERREAQLCVRLTQAPAENSCRPAADVLFRSAARVCGDGVLGVVLTGMGQDGLIGSRAIVEAGGRVLVQDEATCVVWGMPKAVEQAGLADEVLPLGDLALAIERRCQRAAQAKVAFR
jgi:two-component system, chemotaxis family, protein-glutamate methylesterase/glutaminase